MLTLTAFRPSPYDGKRRYYDGPLRQSIQRIAASRRRCPRYSAFPATLISGGDAIFGTAKIRQMHMPPICAMRCAQGRHVSARAIIARRSAQTHARAAGLQAGHDAFDRAMLRPPRDGLFLMAPAPPKEVFSMLPRSELAAQHYFYAIYYRAGHYWPAVPASISMHARHYMQARREYSSRLQSGVISLLILPSRSSPRQGRHDAGRAPAHGDAFSLMMISSAHDAIIDFSPGQPYHALPRHFANGPTCRASACMRNASRRHAARQLRLAMLRRRQGPSHGRSSAPALAACHGERPREAF